MDSTLRRLRRRRIARFGLMVKVTNHAAIAFYERYGFTQVANRPPVLRRRRRRLADGKALAFNNSGVTRSAPPLRPTDMQKEADPWILSRRSVLDAGRGGPGRLGEPLRQLGFLEQERPVAVDRRRDRPTHQQIALGEIRDRAGAPGGNGGYGQGYPNGGGYPGGGGGGGGMGGPSIGIGGIGWPRGAEWAAGGYPGGGRRAGATYKGTVRWESAQPILDALKNPAARCLCQALCDRRPRHPPDRRPAARGRTDGRSGFAQALQLRTDPPRFPRRTIDNLKQCTTLQPKGREMVQPDVVQQMTPGGTYFLFGFAKDRLDFGKNDHEVAFATRLGRIPVKAKFDMKEMLYHGKLAV